MLVDPWPSYASEWTGLIPSADARPLTNGSTDAKQRLADLASFLRNAAGGNREDRYTLSGILLSHMHFDHSEDIAVLLELIAAQTESVASFVDVGTYTDHLGRIYSLAGPPIAIDSLPKICCDYDTLIYLLTYYFYVPYDTIPIDGNEVFRPRGRIRQWERAQGGRIRERRRYWYGNEELEEVLYARARTCIEDRHDRIWNRHGPNGVMSTATWAQVQCRYTLVPGTELVDNDSCSWLEISVVDTNGVQQRLHYDDSYNGYLEDESARCKAGQICQDFDLDNFHITPYVWDHMNTGSFKLSQSAINEQSAGDLQRITAYLIERKDVQDAKRTFIVGSGGEMNNRWTDAMVPNMPTIETHVFIQAIVQPRPHWLAYWPIVGRVVNFADQILAYWEFTTSHIKVKEALILAHFEEFIREVADRARYVDDFNDAVDHNLDVLRDKIDELRRRGDERSTDLAGMYTALFDDNRIYVLGRRGGGAGFEIDMPNDPIEFENETNTHLG